MPVSPTYPGVYIEEIPSGVRTITGVATSITAFIGRTSRGPVNKATTINSYGDFERIFGGLWVDSTTSFAIRDFYLNGGSQAIIVRLFHPTFADETARLDALATATVEAQTSADTVSTAAANAVAGATTTTLHIVANAAALAAADAAGDAASAAATAVSEAAAVAAAEATTLQDVADAAAAAVVEAGTAGAEAMAAATAVSVAAADAVAGAANPQVVADAAAAAAAAAGAAGGIAMAAATAVSEAAAGAVAGAASPQAVANAAAAAVVDAGPAGAAALAAGTAVSEAAAGAVAGAISLQVVADAAAVEAAAAGATGGIAMAAATAVSEAVAEVVARAATPQNVADAAAAAVADAVTSAAEAEAPVTNARLSAGELNLEAAYPGKWGNSLRVRVDRDVVGSDAANIFNLSLKDGTTGQIEIFRNVSVQTDHLRQVDKVLEQQSKLVRIFGERPEERPAKSGNVSPGADPFGNDSSSGVTTLASDGKELTSDNYTGNQEKKEGLYALEQVDLFNLLCIPPFSPAKDVEPTTFWDTAAQYCESRRAMLIVDSPQSWLSKDLAKGNGSTTGIAALGTRHKNAAVFFPRLVQPNPEQDNRIEEFAPCGAVAGLFARTDTQRGVWKAPAGLDARLVGVPQLSVPLTDLENGELNPLGINCLRTRPAVGRVIWGARTLQGDDRIASEWKYIPVRRLALFIEESLYRGTQWVVFEPNDEPLWSQIRLNIGAFMHNLFRQGAFQGTTPRQAYFVKCDKETTTQTDIDRGIVNILIGFAPLKPAEFVIIKLQQIAGELEV